MEVYYLCFLWGKEWWWCREGLGGGSFVEQLFTEGWGFIEIGYVLTVLVQVSAV